MQRIRGGERLQGSESLLARAGFCCRSAMTWRSAANKICTSFALPYGYLTPNESLPKMLWRTLKSLWRCRW
jgi:hypothetical protein